MREINFYDKSRNKVIHLYDFQIKDNQCNPIFFDFKGKITFDFFNINANFYAEINDFKQLLNSLRQMYVEKKKIAVFNPLDPKVSIKIEFHNLRNIEVMCNFSNNISACLNFSYTIDQSFLPELIEEISDVIK
jgi:hypothetical protein